MKVFFTCLKKSWILWRICDLTFFHLPILIGHPLWPHQDNQAKGHLGPSLSHHASQEVEGMPPKQATVNVLTCLSKNMLKKMFSFFVLLIFLTY